MRLSRKIIVPIHLILSLVLGASLYWEWRKLVGMEHAVLAARLEGEARMLRSVDLALQSSTDGSPSDTFALFVQAQLHPAHPSHRLFLVDRPGWLRDIASGERLQVAGIPPDGESWALELGTGSYLARSFRCQSGRLVLAASTDAIDGNVRSALIELAGWYLVLGLALMISVDAVLRKVVLRPLEKLSTAVKGLGLGQYGIGVDAEGGDELALLGRDFNTMSTTLAERVEADRVQMEIASRVQGASTPPPRLEIGRIEVAGRCIQAGPVGGDVFDVLELPDGTTGLLVADISGHNIAAALHTALVRAAVRTLAVREDQPGEILATLNRVLYQDLPEEHFASAFYALFDPQSGKLCYSNAGHPPALLLDARGNLVELDPRGPLLGIFSEFEYESIEVSVFPGTRLLVFSDGLIEDQGADGRILGAEVIASAFRNSATSDTLATIDHILAIAESHRAGNSQQDDITIALCAGSCGVLMVGRPTHEPT